MRDFAEIEAELRFAAYNGCDHTLLIEAADALAAEDKLIQKLSSIVVRNAQIRITVDELKETADQIVAKSTGTIYIITAGEYSDYGIIAATKDKATAERIKNAYNRDSKYEQAEIEEFSDAIEEHEMNEYKVIIKNAEILYSVPMERVKGVKETVCDAHQFEDYKRGKPDGTSWRIIVIAESEGTARKIAKDYVIQKEAEAQGL